MHLPTRRSLRPHRAPGDRPRRAPLGALPHRVPAAEGRSRAGAAVLAELDAMAADVVADGRTARPEPAAGQGRRHPRG